MTVAGDAYARSRISKIIFMFISMRMRSLEASVSSRLSSITEFMFSIQLASRSPSRMTHFGLESGAFCMSRIVVESMPSFHSRVAMLMKP